MMNCRHCHSELKLSFIDLGSAPPSNAYLTKQMLQSSEKYFPLKVLVCTKCWLAQTEDYAGASELFSPEYAYFSSYSKSWLQHAEKYVEKMIRLFKLNSDSLVIEVAANDGYLLQYAQDRKIPCLGIEPTRSTALAARAKGLEIVEDFFGVRLAKKLVGQGKSASLTAANNVLAHVPDINDFVSGFSILLKPDGIATFEFPHLLNLVEQNQFDTIYHEHYSYLSLVAVKRIFESNGLNIFDVEELATHGGSLRIYAQRNGSGKQKIKENVDVIISREKLAGMEHPHFYSGFQAKAEKVKNEFLKFLEEAKRKNKKVVAYGAAAKGNTLLNYAGIHQDLISFVVDANPAKQGKFLPGSRVPIVKDNSIRDLRPDYVVILPWNLKTEVINQLEYIREWGGKFVIAIPALDIL